MVGVAVCARRRYVNPRVSKRVWSPAVFTECSRQTNDMEMIAAAGEGHGASCFAVKRVACRYFVLQRDVGRMRVAQRQIMGPRATAGGQ